MVTPQRPSQSEYTFSNLAAMLSDRLSHLAVSKVDRRSLTRFQCDVTYTQHFSDDVSTLSELKMTLGLRSSRMFWLPLQNMNNMYM